MPCLLLLGGAKRVTLAEQILALLASSSQTATLFSIERDDAFYPISTIAKALKGPSFLSDDFTSFLEALASRHNALPIGCMDAALPHLSRLRGRQFGNTRIVAHDESAAIFCLDKRLTEDFCQKNGIPTPKAYNPGQPLESNLIVKPAKGFGAKGILSFDNEAHKFVPDLGPDYVYQEKLTGQETTHDLYINAQRRVVASSRDRLSVIDGEVDHCIVRHPTAQESVIFEQLAATGLFWGPLTVQTFKTPNNQTVLIEINARLGGGVTASIAAGVPILENYFGEAFDIEFPHRPIHQLEMKRARRDFYRILS
jgi:carbamoyl-phosphate synthase large subunit